MDKVKVGKERKHYISTVHRDRMLGHLTISAVWAECGPDEESTTCSTKNMFAFFLLTIFFIDCLSFRKPIYI